MITRWCVGSVGCAVLIIDNVVMCCNYVLVDNLCIISNH